MQDNSCTFCPPNNAQKTFCCGLVFPQGVSLHPGNQCVGERRAINAWEKAQPFRDCWGRSQAVFSARPTWEPDNQTAASGKAKNARKSEILQALCADQCTSDKINIFLCYKTPSSWGSLHPKQFVTCETCLLSKSSWKQQVPKRHCYTFCAELCAVCAQGFPITSIPTPLILAVCCETESLQRSHSQVDNILCNWCTTLKATGLLSCL